jgi:hypothetical protein
MASSLERQAATPEPMLAKVSQAERPATTKLYAWKSRQLSGGADDVTVGRHSLLDGRLTLSI